MALKSLKARLILDYKHFFGVEPPENSVSIINHISKEHILCEIAALNYRLKPVNQIRIDDSLDTQVRELKYFAKTEELLEKYLNFFTRYIVNKDDYPCIFNRQACVFAIEEIVNSDEMRVVEDFVMARVEVWEAIIKYFLAVNFAITKIKEDSDGDSKVNFESLNPKILPLNELQVETDQIFTPYRGYLLIDFFLNNPHLKDEVQDYFKEVYGVDPQHFIFHVMEMYMANNSENPDHNFIYQVQEGRQKIFDRMSERVPNKETYKLVSIRKSPFIKFDERKYFLADNTFLIEKTYSQFINDFWFDRVKKIKDETGELKFDIKYYRGEFGYFFESYLSHILLRSFEKYKYSVLLMFDQLKAQTSQGQEEIADVYFRYDNKILLGQVKSGSIYDAEKFGGSVDALYKNDRNKFFKKFGVDQVVDSLTRMHNYIQILDPKFPKGHSYEVYPCIIVNDKAFQTPLMADTFNIRFQELLQGFSINKVKVNPLTILHISDLETLQEPLNRKPKEIWGLLQFNFRNKKFIPPFYNTINFKVERLMYPARVMELYQSLINRYNPTEE